MYSSLRVLSVIPARGGSKGVKLKNLRTIAGKTLVAHAVGISSKVSFIDTCIVSTDHDKIRQEAISCGAKVPFLRPEDLSGDRIGDLDVLTHTLIEAEKYFDVRFDIVLMLQPTSPLRRPEDIVACIEKLVMGKFDAVWTVTNTDLKYHPLKQLVINDTEMSFFDERASKIVARQQLAPVYHRNGCCYAFTRECLIEQKSIMGKRTGAIVIDRPLISIDTEDDILLTEKIYNSTLKFE